MVWARLGHGWDMVGARGMVGARLGHGWGKHAWGKAGVWLEQGWGTVELMTFNRLGQAWVMVGAQN